MLLHIMNPKNGPEIGFPITFFGAPGSRDDAVGMQCYIPGWTFNAKKPCMVRP